MANNSKTIAEVVREAKIRIAENKLTMKELSDNVPADEQLLNILLDDGNGVVKALSDLVAFMQVKITGTRQNKFITHRFIRSGEQIKVIRALHPKCSIVYDTVSKNLYDFKTKYKSEELSDHSKQLIINELAEAVEKYVD